MVQPSPTEPNGSAPSNHPDTSPRAAWLSPAAAALPLGVAGGLVGLLLLFLNPGSATAPLSVARIVAAYAAVGASLGGLLVLPFLWRNLHRAAKTFPWLMTLVLITGAAYFATHASRWSYYLPTIANRHLLFAALVLFACALPAFYTALLHTVHQRSYSYRSLGLVSCCGLLALSVLALLRPPPSFPPQRLATPPSVPAPDPIIVIGLDGATLEVLLPMAEKGLLPLLGSWMSGGVVAPIEAITPPRATALWASAATGTWPFHHGVLAPTVVGLPWAGSTTLRMLPEGLWFRDWGLLGSTERAIDDLDLQRKPLWRVYRDLGYTAEVSGWPPRSSSTMLELPSSAAGTDASMIRVDDLVAASESSLGAWIRSRRGQRESGSEALARQLEDAYQAVDRRLASWRGSLPRNAVVAVISVRGYAPLPAWRQLLGRFSGAPSGRATARGGHDGVLILYGPGIRQGERLPRVRVVDLMPTLAYAAGLPVAADLDGEVITRAFAPEGLADRPLTFVPSYEAWDRDETTTTTLSRHAEGRTAE